MWRCNECGRTFDTPDYVEICWEDEYGVMSMFPNHHYGVIAVCPECGDREIEETYDYEEEFDEFEE